MQLEAHLAAVRVPGQRQLDAQLGGARKRIGIVRKQNVRHVAPHQRLDPCQHRLGTIVETARRPLVVHADQIERLPVPHQLDIFLPQHAHAVPREQLRRGAFRLGINLVIAVAAPDAQRRLQPGKFPDATLERIARPGHKIAGHHGQIGL